MREAASEPSGKMEAFAKLPLCRGWHLMELRGNASLDAILKHGARGFRAVKKYWDDKFKTRQEVRRDDGSGQLAGHFTAAQVRADGLYGFFEPVKRRNQQ